MAERVEWCFQFIFSNLRWKLHAGPDTKMSKMSQTDGWNNLKKTSKYYLTLFQLITIINIGIQADCISLNKILQNILLLKCFMDLFCSKKTADSWPWKQKLTKQSPLKVETDTTVSADGVCKILMEMKLQLRPSTKVTVLYWEISFIHASQWLSHSQLCGK